MQGQGPSLLPGVDCSGVAIGRQGSAGCWKISSSTCSAPGYRCPRSSAGCRSPSCSAQPSVSIANFDKRRRARSEEHTSELQSLMRISYAVFRLKKKNIHDNMFSDFMIYHDFVFIVIIILPH